MRPNDTCGADYLMHVKTSSGVLNDMRESLNGACARAGVPRIHVHGLRHTFGSQMAMAGAEPFAIMKAMGHADMKTTMIYVSLGKSHIREQVEKLNSIPIPKSPYAPCSSSCQTSTVSFLQ